MQYLPQASPPKSPNHHRRCKHEFVVILFQCSPPPADDSFHVCVFRSSTLLLYAYPYIHTYERIARRSALPPASTPVVDPCPNRTDRIYKFAPELKYSVSRARSKTSFAIVQSKTERKKYRIKKIIKVLQTYSECSMSTDHFAHNPMRLDMMAKS